MIYTSAANTAPSAETTKNAPTAKRSRPRSEVLRRRPRHPHEDEYRDQQLEQQPVRGQHVDNQQIVHGISFRGAIPFNLRMAKSATSCQVIA